MRDQSGAGAPPGPTARIQRVLPASPNVVYDEWLDSDALSDWMCPRPARCLGVHIEARVGGNFRFDIEDSGIEFFVVGQFRTLDRPRQVSFTWHCSTWPAADVESLVTVSFEPQGEGETLMTIEHTLLPPGLVEQHRRGWAAIAIQLSDVLSNSAAAIEPVCYDSM